jgi:hypothetical protein
MHADAINTKMANGALVKELQKPVLVPYGEKLVNNKEKRLWRAYTRARPSDAWREDELIHLVEVIKLLTQIDKEVELMEAEGTIVYDRFGSPKPNPRLSVVTHLRSREMKLRSSLGLTASLSSPAGSGTVYDAMKKQQKAQAYVGSVIAQAAAAQNQDAPAFTPLTLIARAASA